MSHIDISVIIVSYNTRDLTCEAVASALRAADELPGHALEVIVVDNASADDTASALRHLFANDTRFTLIANDDNRGFGAANNQAFQIARGRYLFLLNPDAAIQPTATQTLLDFCDAHPDCAIAAPRLTYADGSLHRSVRRLPSPRRLVFTELLVDRFLPGFPPARDYLMTGFRHEQRGLVEQPQGAALFIRRTALRAKRGERTQHEAVGVFDEQFFLYFEEVDLCARLIDAGWEIWFVPEATVVHHENQSSNKFWPEARRHYYDSMLKYFRKHYGTLYGAAVVKGAIAIGFPIQMTFIVGAGVKRRRTPDEVLKRLKAHATTAWHTLRG